MKLLTCCCKDETAETYFFHKNIRPVCQGFLVVSFKILINTKGIWNYRKCWHSKFGVSLFKNLINNRLFEIHILTGTFNLISICSWIDVNVFYRFSRDLRQTLICRSRMMVTLLENCWAIFLKIWKLGWYVNLLSFSSKV